MTGQCHDDFWITQHIQYIFHVPFVQVHSQTCTHLAIHPIPAVIYSWLFTDALVSWYEAFREMLKAPVFFLLPQPAQRWEDVSLWNKTDREDASYFAARTWTDKIRILKDNPSHCVQSWREDMRRASKSRKQCTVMEKSVFCSEPELMLMNHCKISMLMHRVDTVCLLNPLKECSAASEPSPASFRASRT